VAVGAAIERVAVTGLTRMFVPPPSALAAGSENDPDKAPGEACAAPVAVGAGIERVKVCAPTLTLAAPVAVTAGIVSETELLPGEAVPPPDAVTARTVIPTDKTPTLMAEPKTLNVPMWGLIGCERPRRAIS